MKQENVLYGIIGVVLGALIAGLVAASAVNSGNQNMMRMMGMQATEMHQEAANDDAMNMSMDAMTSSLKGKTGDEFDKAFISEMIVHHQGAIDMANLAKQHAKHEEIKTLADAIVSAQAKEIQDMRAWQLQWNYTDNSMQMMHGSH